MKEFLDYFSVGVPSWLFYSSIGITVIVILATCALKNKRDKRRMIVRTLLLEYVFVVVCSTIIFRGVAACKFDRLELQPFWTYKSIIAHTQGVSIWDIVLNIVLFIPLGLLVKLLYPKVTAIRMLGISVISSLFIETNQYIFERGVTQFDDVMHNVVGALLGWLLAKIVLQRKRPMRFDTTY